MIKNKTLIVIGGGASGIFCAVNAARLSTNLRVIVLEKTSKLLSKVKVSGGGRCNVTNSCDDIQEMSTRYPRGKNFVKKAFHGFFTTNTIEWFQERGVQLKKEADGRIFPVSNKSESIIECLLAEASKYQVEIILSTNVLGMQQSNGKWIIDSDQLGNKRQFVADYVFAATGGLQKKEQYAWVTNLGHTIVDPVPSLFSFNIADQEITSLMGISMQYAAVKIPQLKKRETGSLLITHWGLSGPVILKLSSWAARDLYDLNYHFEIQVQWLPDQNDQSLRNEFQNLRTYSGSEKVSGRSLFSIPHRLWEFLLQKAHVPAHIRWSEMQSSQINKLIQLLISDSYLVKGKTTFKEEFVTAGGITLSEIEPHTMKSKLFSGLYFGGELINVDGITGGYNFQNAWTSGFLAAKDIASINEEIV